MDIRVPKPLWWDWLGVVGAVGFQEQVSRDAHWPRHNLHFSVPKLDSFSMLENAPKCLSLMEKGICEVRPTG